MSAEGFSVDDLLRVVGFFGLGETPSLEAVEAVLIRFGEALADLSPLRRDVLREGAIAALIAAGVRSPVRLVDTALGSGAGPQAAADVSRWATHGPPIIDVVRTPEGLRYLTARSGEGVRITESVEDRERWPMGSLPWPAVPDAGAVMFAFEAGAEAPFQELRELIRTRVVLPEPQSAWSSLLAAWCLGTYLLDRLPYYPLVLLEGPAERGKTRLARVLTWPAYRGVLAISTSSAMLVRDRAWHRVTLALDVEDLPRTIERGDYLGDLLLASYERDGQVRRCTRPDAPPPEQAECLPAYGATIAITNRSIPDHSPLASRCIRVPMPEAGARRVPDGLTPSDAASIRARAVAWAARLAVEDVELPTVDVDLRGRARDLALPLLRILQLIAPSELPAVAELLGLVDADRRAEVSRSWEARIAVALWDARHLVEAGRLYIEDLTTIVNTGASESERLTAQQVGTARRALSLKGGRGGHSPRAYLTWPGDEAVLSLRERYSGPDPADPAASAASAAFGPERGLQGLSPSSGIISVDSINVRSIHKSEDRPWRPMAADAADDAGSFLPPTDLWGGGPLEPDEGPESEGLAL